MKCGDVYRDLDGNFNYTCSCCSFEFMSAIDFEEHVSLHFADDVDIVKEEFVEDVLPSTKKRNIRIEIEPVLKDPIAMEEYDESEILIAESLDEEDINEEYDDQIYVIESLDNINMQSVLNEIIDQSNAEFRCDCCDKLYACRGLRAQHLHNFVDDKNGCPQCPAYYEKEAELNAHIKVHSLANTMTCPHCSEVFASVNKMKRHLNSSKSETNSSPKKRIKKKIVETKQETIESNEDEENDEDHIIEDEIEIDTSDTGAKKRNKFICGICKKEYSYLYYLKKHLKRHSDNTLNHSCEICGHEFKLRQNLTAHMRTHTGEKPYKCKLCGKAFNQPYYMTIHMRIHQKEKPYQCKLCGVAFVTSSHLGRHMKSHNNIKPHKCTICDRAFILPGHLQDHIRSQHTGERPFACDVCGNAFSRRKLLRQHKQLHGEKRFKCKYCDLVFSQSAGRRGHEIRVHNAS